MTKYFLRIKYYKYNTGAADNGFYLLDIPCSSPSEAEQLRDKLKTIKKYEQDSRWLDKHTGVFGYIEEIGNIYKQTTERIN